jgi:hypothetical protein
MPSFEAQAEHRVNCIGMMHRLSGSIVAVRLSCNAVS